MSLPTRKALLILALALVVVMALLVARHWRAAPTQASAPVAATPNTTTPPALPSAAPAPAANSKTPGTRTIEVCGVGLVETDDNHELPPRLADAFDGSARLQRAVAELGASANASDRAVALVYEARRAEFAGQSAGNPSVLGCLSDPTCLRAIFENGRLAAQGYVQSLAQLATQSADPVAFALAFYACGFGPPARRAPGCDAITAQRWTTIDPDNGVAWLAAAAVAANTHDEAARVAALEHAADAPRFDPYSTALLRPLDSPVLEQATPLQRLYVSVETANAMAVRAGYSTATVARDYCKAPLAAERTPLCDRLATALIERDNSYMGHTAGVRIGEAAGWPTARLASLKQESEALHMMWRDGPPEVNGILACAAIDAQMRRYTETLHVGERAALRGQLARSGKSVAQLSNEYRALYGEQERQRASQAR